MSANVEEKGIQSALLSPTNPFHRTMTSLAQILIKWPQKLNLK